MALAYKIAQNTLIQFFGKIIGTILALITVGFMMRYLGQEGFGEYSIIVSFLGIFSTVADLGLYLIVTREISRDEAEIDKILSNVFTLRFISGFIILALAPLTVLFFPYSYVVKVGVAIGTLSFLFVSLLQILVGIFQKHLDMGKVAAGEIIGRLIWLGGVVLAVYLKQNLLFMIGVISLSSALNFFIVFLFSRKYVRIYPLFDLKMWKSIIKATAPLAVAVILNLIYFKIDTILLSVLRPISEVGIYGAAHKVLENLVTFAAIFAGLLLPVLSKYVFTDKDKFSKIYRQGFNVLSILVLPLIVGTLFVAEPMMLLFGGEEFVLSAGVLKILIFAVGAIFFAQLFGNAVVACNQQNKMMWIYLVCAVLSIVLNLILIPRFSYFGAAFVAVFVEVLICFTTAYVVFRSTRIGPELKVFLKSFIATLIMAFILFLIKSWGLAALILIGALVYFLALYLLKGFSKKDLLEIIRIRT